jgi:hypothetical protein
MAYQANSYRCTIEWIDPAKPTRFQKSVAQVAAPSQDLAMKLAYEAAGITAPYNPGSTSTSGTPVAYAACISPNVLAGATKVTVFEIQRSESSPNSLAIGGTAPVNP